jgi:hypothetical protein
MTTAPLIVLSLELLVVALAAFIFGIRWFGPEHVRKWLMESYTGHFHLFDWKR